MPGLSQWTAAVALALDDIFGITDVNDTTQSVNGSSKKVTLSQLLSFAENRLREEPVSSGAVTFNCEQYHTFVMTVTGAITITLDNFLNGQTISVILTNAGANVTWPSEVKWPGGVEPEFSTTGEDRVVFQRVSGSTIHGSLAGQEYA